MNRKQFLILVVALVVLGGAGIALFYQEIAAYRTSGARIGAKLLPEFKLAEVAQVRLQDAKAQTTLVRKDTGWVVRERGDYPASFEDLSSLMVKLVELKVTQSENIGPSLLPRLALAEPGKGEGSGTLVEFKDAQGKTLARLVLGKTVLKKDPLNPLPSAVDGVPAGRYVLPSHAKGSVVVVSDPLAAADAAPGKWLSKEFLKVERIRTLAVTPPEGAGWKIVRTEEWGQWKFASGGGGPPAGRAVVAGNSLGGMSFKDIVADLKPESLEKPWTVVAETFDNLAYTIRIAKGKSDDEFLLNANVAGDPPQARVPEKGEKPEQKAQRDKDFQEGLKRLQLRLAREKAQSSWVYVVARKEVEPFLKTRTELVAGKGDRGDGLPPGMRPPF
jgi:hypothetical protein